MYLMVEIHVSGVKTVLNIYLLLTWYILIIFGIYMMIIIDIYDDNYRYMIIIGIL